jgi:ABC-type oligopeptide transport system ATPase subunit
LDKPTKGTVLVNDIDIQDYEPRVIREKLSVLFQDFRTSTNFFGTNTQGRYSGISAEDNIAIGSGGFSKSISPVRVAAEQVGIHEKICSFMPYYATRLYQGSQVPRPDREEVYVPGHGWVRDDQELPFVAKVLKGDPHLQAKIRGKHLSYRAPPAAKGGVRDVDIAIPERDPAMESTPEHVDSGGLSGGQWQKIAMARAFMKIRDADLVILDEPTSALDPQAEYELFKTLMEVRKNRTTIFIVLPLLNFSDFLLEES